MVGKNIYSFLLSFILVIALGMVFIENADTITGHATEGSTYSNVSIQKYLSINFGPNLAEGIYFGNVATLPATDINATHDYDGASNATTYFINVSTDSNTAVDFCIKANAGLTNAGGAVIGLANETYAAINSTSNATSPALALQLAMTTGYISAVNKTSPGNSSYWRFWLDIPAAQEAGDYNNTVSFKGITTGLAC